jgi:DegV family protein with EDD domain
MIAIVTDSSAYLTRKEAESLGIHVVPLNYSFNDRVYQESYIDNNGDYEQLISIDIEKCTTSQASVAVFMSTFDKLLRQGYDVLCIVLSSRLSGTYSSASIAAKELNKERIMVIDSLTTAGGLSILVKKAGELAKKGAALTEAVSKIKQLRNNIGIAFSVDSMDSLRRSGRLGIVRQSVGTILNIRPILLCDEGVIISQGQVRGKAERINKLLGKMPSNPEEIIIHYLGNKEMASIMFSEVRKRFPKANTLINRIGPVLGIHLGIGVIGIAWFGK